MESPSPLVVSVRRHKPELVVPEKSTPREIKPLSDIDDQEGLRFQIPFIMFYGHNPSMETKDPVKIIRQALARTLVFYYPLAGRLIEGPNRKLMVDCNGQGVLFIEGDSDVRLDQLGNMVLPRCPYLEELLYDVPGTGGIIGCPLLLFQVTRFTCGGFALALRLNHTMSDAFGLVQFLNTIGEFARGEAHAPSQLPVWQREILNARDPPRITCLHREYEEVVMDDTKSTVMGMDMDMNNMVHRSFFFGPKELKAIRRHLPPQEDRKCSTYEVLTVCIWRCRTTALKVDPNEIVRVSGVCTARAIHGLDIPSGYYGNAHAYPAAQSNAEMLCKKQLGYAVDLIKKAKAQMSKEYMKSVADLMVIKGRPLYTPVWNYLISDTTHAGFHKVDFGWGKPIYGGPATAISLISLYAKFKNSQGEDGIVLLICMPLPAMERFLQELEKMTQEVVKDSYDTNPIKVMSRL